MEGVERRMAGLAFGNGGEAGEGLDRGGAAPYLVGGAVRRADEAVEGEGGVEVWSAACRPS